MFARSLTLWNTKMKYRLKNKKAQNALEEIFGDKFSEELKKEALKCEPYLNLCLPLYSFEGVDKRFSHARFKFLRADIEAYEEYDPNKWNTASTTEAPTEVLMRCEYFDEDYKKWCFSATCRYVHDLKTYKWFDQEGNEREVHRYRPWNE